jgi:hypothetical protein
MLRAVLSSIGKNCATRSSTTAVQANLAYSTSPAGGHHDPNETNFYEMVELFFDRAGELVHSILIQVLFFQLYCFINLSTHQNRIKQSLKMFHTGSVSYVLNKIIFLT